MAVTLLLGLPRTAEAELPTEIPYGMLTLELGLDLFMAGSLIDGRDKP